MLREFQLKGTLARTRFSIQQLEESSQFITIIHFITPSAYIWQQPIHPILFQSCYNYHLVQMIEDQKATIYVGNLPQGITSQDLYAYLSTFGEIRSVQIPIDHISQLQRGFAFVQFDQKQDADSAIDNYDKSEYQGRTLRVRRAKPLETKHKYHEAVWANDKWLQNIENDKIETQNLTKEQQDKNRAEGLPVYKNLPAKNDEKPIVYVEND